MAKYLPAGLFAQSIQGVAIRGQSTRSSCRKGQRKCLDSWGLVAEVPFLRGRAGVGFEMVATGLRSGWWKKQKASPRREGEPQR